MNDSNNYELYHYGVKGMKWGVRKSRNAVNKNYTAKQRKRDRAFYGKRGEKRINRRLNEGHGLQGARHYEAERKERVEKTKKTAKKVARKTLGAIGSIYLSDQFFNGGRLTRSVGRAAVTAFLKAKGHTNIRWYN